MSVGPVGSSASVPSTPPTSVAPASAAASASAASASAVTRGSQPQNPLAAVAAAPPTPTGMAAADEMLAFDHLRDLLVQAGGGDRRIARSEARGLVEALRKDGRGTEALAAKQLFQLIDDFDSARGATVTEYDLDRARPLLQMWMASGDGSLGTLGQALKEIGEVDTYDHRPLVQRSWPERGMEQVAGLLKQAMGPDGVLSRADARGLVRTLEAQGRGTEALGAEMFFRFIDHRDHRPGARVTASDIDRAVTYAREHLLRNKDADGNERYDQAEMDTFSQTAKAFLHVGALAVLQIRPPEVQGPAPSLPSTGIDRFVEEQPMPDGWSTTDVRDQGTVLVDAQGALQLTGISGSDLKETRFLEAAFREVWDGVLSMRAWPAGAPADLADNGALHFGVFDDPQSGETYHVAHWSDIDDSSFVFYFKESQASTAADPQFELAHTVFLN